MNSNELIFREKLSMIAAERMIFAINKFNLMHRKGWFPADYIGKTPDGKHLLEEAEEVVEALQELYNFNDNKSKAHVLEEIADTFTCLMQIAYRLGFSFEEINQESVRKMRKRFKNADKVNLATLELEK